MSDAWIVCAACNGATRVPDGQPGDGMTECPACEGHGSVRAPSELDRLREFAALVCDGWLWGNVDLPCPGHLQDEALRLGVIVPVTPPEDQDPDSPWYGLAWKQKESEVQGE